MRDYDCDVASGHSDVKTVTIRLIYVASGHVAVRDSKLPVGSLTQKSVIVGTLVCGCNLIVCYV